MKKNKIEEKINRIYKDFRKNYEGDHYQYQWLDRDKLLSIC